MYFIHGGRASGKTTYLLKMSAATGNPILTTEYWRIRIYEDYAKHLGLNIPKPVLWRDHDTKLNSGSKVFIDDGEITLRHILSKAGVTCTAMAIVNPVMHITNCFLDSPESLPSEVLGGKFESMDIEQAYQLGIWAERLKEK